MSLQNFKDLMQLLPFWKKQKYNVNHPEIDISPFSFEEPINSFSSSKWNEQTYSNIRYRLTVQNTILRQSLNYDILSQNEVEQKGEDMLLVRATLKNRILQNLHNTLDNDLDKECKEEGIKQFSKTIKENAKSILNIIYDKFPNYEYFIYPTDNCEIAIDCNPQKGRGVLILCDSDGGIACFATFDGKNRRFRYDSMSDLPHTLLYETFKDLDKENKYFLNEYVTKIGLPMSSSSYEESYIPRKPNISSDRYQYECA